MVYDLAVVGSGIGGSLTAALQAQKKSVLLFEKEPYLGGCASTFKRGKYWYNAGATTFAGYEEGSNLKQIFDTIGFTPDLIESAPAIRIMQNGYVIDRVEDFEQFLAQIERVYPHPNNRVFWELIHTLDQAFWKMREITYLKYSHQGRLQTLRVMFEMFQTFGKYLYQNARKVIESHLTNISQAYIDFLDAQLLITLQAKSSEVSFISAAIGLAYPFHKLYYPIGGMGALFEGLLKEVNVHTKERVQHVKSTKSHIEIETTKDTYQAKQIVLNSTVFDSGKLFEAQKATKYYQTFKQEGKGAFVLYLKVNSPKTFLHHYQVILEKQIPYALSNAFFISFSDTMDSKLQEGGYSVTISTHTDPKVWENLDKATYQKQKESVQNYLLEMFLAYFAEVLASEVTQAFSATPKTFDRYILRHNAGGIALTPMNFIKYPSCDTPIENVYQVGDTIFPGQGWPGVAMGVKILQKVLHGTC